MPKNCACVGVGCRVIKTQREIEAKTEALALDARTDPLTSLPNRRAVEGWAVKQISGAFRHGYPIWVVLADLDCYKPAADLFGRAAETRCCRRSPKLSGRTRGFPTYAARLRTANHGGGLAWRGFVIARYDQSPDGNAENHVERIWLG